MIYFISCAINEHVVEVKGVNTNNEFFISLLSV